MAILMETVQTDTWNTIGVFDSVETAEKFLAALPFASRNQDETGTWWTLDYGRMPPLHTAYYNGWKVAFARASYRPLEQGGEIDVMLSPITCLDQPAPAEAAYVEGEVLVDAHLYLHSEVAQAVHAREMLFTEIADHFVAQGKRVSRAGLGSEDGEYALVTDPDSSDEGELLIHLDPQTLALRVSSASITDFLKAVGEMD